MLDTETDPELIDCHDCGEPTSLFDDGTVCDNLDCDNVSHAGCQRVADDGYRTCQDCG